MTRTRPAVTIITPVYNGESYLAETIASIQAQTFADFEYFIVDDCSTDGSAKIAKDAAAQDPRIHYLKSPSNFGGPAGPRNIGVEAGVGEWVAFCDADDLWTPDKLEAQVALAKAKDAVLVSSRIIDFADNTPLPDLSEFQNVTSVSPIELRELVYKNRIALSSVLVPRKILDLVGPFETARDHIAVEDYDMWLRILHTTGKDALRINRPLVYYRRVEGSISANKLKMLKKAMRMQRKVFQKDGRDAIFWLRLPWALTRYVIVAAWTRKVRSGL